MEKYVAEKFEGKLGKVLFFRRKLLNKWNEQPPEDYCPWCSALENWAIQNCTEISDAILDYKLAIDELTKMLEEDYEEFVNSSCEF